MVVLFLVDFATAWNKILGLFLLSSIRQERYAIDMIGYGYDLAALRDFL